MRELANRMLARRTACAARPPAPRPAADHSTILRLLPRKNGSVGLVNPIPLEDVVAPAARAPRRRELPLEVREAAAASRTALRHRDGWVVFNLRQLATAGPGRLRRRVALAATGAARAAAGSRRAARRPRRRALQSRRRFRRLEGSGAPRRPGAGADGAASIAARVAAAASRRATGSGRRRPGAYGAGRALAYGRRQPVAALAEAERGRRFSRCSMRQPPRTRSCGRYRGPAAADRARAGRARGRLLARVGPAACRAGARARRARASASAVGGAPGRGRARSGRARLGARATRGIRRTSAVAPLDDRARATACRARFAEAPPAASATCFRTQHWLQLTSRGATRARRFVRPHLMQASAGAAAKGSRTEAVVRPLRPGIASCRGAQPRGAPRLRVCHRYHRGFSVSGRLLCRLRAGVTLSFELRRARPCSAASRAWP